ncbi:hypothetical protein BVRB_3g057130 [Beta vulgaris subsp. vulgaris]|nr:hypothetical protein BVRB_3g057130 [Beta vulgaris subsp. vulgaris]
MKKIQSSLQIRFKELELKEQHLNWIQKSCEHRQKLLELREKQFKSTEKFVCDRCKTLGLKVSETGNVVVKIEAPNDFRDDYSKQDACIKLFVTMDGKTLQMFLNDRVDDHVLMGEEVKSAIKLSSDPAKLVLDAMEGFFPPHLMKSKLEYEGNVVRSSCVLLLEQLMELKPEIKKAVREEARTLAGVWSGKMRVERRYMVVLGFLLLVVVYSLWSDFDKDELRSLCEIVEQHKVVGEVRSRLSFLQKCGVSSMAPQVQKKEPYTPPVKNVFVSPSTDSSIELRTLCKEMDGNGLKSYLIKHVKDLKLFEEKVLDCLLYASDPAKLVFNVVQEFYLELDDIQGETNISCCKFLLDHLMKLSPQINCLLKEEALNFAARWKARLAMESTKPFLVFGFLKFIAAYKLSSSFQADEILSLFTILYDRDDIFESEQNRSLCRALGLEAKIPDLIRSLIKENKRLEAVRCICAFNLADKFPPAPLLKAYLEYTKTTALKTCENFNCPIKSQNKCANRQIHALQSVIRCILDFKLDYEYSPIELQQQIRQLEQEKEARNSSKPKKEKGKKKKFAPTTPGCQSDPIGMRKRAFYATTNKTQLLQGYSQEKRPHTDTAQNAVFPNVSVAIDSNINSLDPPSPDFPPYGFDDTSYRLVHNLSSDQFGAFRMPFSSISPAVNPTSLHTNFLSSFPHTPRFSTPSSAGYSSKYNQPP